MNTLLPTLVVLRDASILDILCVKIEDYQRKHGVQPQIVRVADNLRTALTKELICKCGIAPDCAVAEPFWLGSIPIIYSHDLGEHYLELRSAGGRILEHF